MLRFVNIGVSTATPGNLFPNAEGAGRHAARQEWSPKIAIRLTNLSPVLSAKGTAGMLDKKDLTHFKSKIRHQKLSADGS